jgi:Leucine-rich repeat (LRR) protein
MCILCNGDYNENLLLLNCSSCIKIKEIPYLPNLQYLDCSYTKIKELPILPNLQLLICDNTEITEIPYLSNLLYLDCDLISVSKITYLHNIYNLWRPTSYPNNKNKINELYIKQKLKRKLLNLYRLHKRLSTLWKIAEYYTIIKYHPNNLTEEYILSLSK